MGDSQTLEAEAETGPGKHIVDRALLQDPERQTLPSQSEPISTPVSSNLASTILSGNDLR